MALNQKAISQNRFQFVFPDGPVPGQAGSRTGWFQDAFRNAFTEQPRVMRN